MKSLKEILLENEFLFKKHFGQNFLTDTNLLKAIAQDANITFTDEVLEIGPGAGTLTRVLAQSAKKVVCYEVDTTLKPVLEEMLKDFNNVDIIFKDILKQDNKSLKEHFDNNFKVVANLPYYITTPILFKFLDSDLGVESLTIMVQKEVAQRLTAKPRTKNYGALTISANYRADIKITRLVSRKLFVPAPNVDSAIVNIKFNKQKYEIKEETLLNKLIKVAFNMRRKTLFNNLKQGFGFSAQKVQSLLLACNLSLLVRAEELEVGQFVLLANLIKDFD